MASWTDSARSLIAFTDKEPKDWMVPSRWGTVRTLAPLIVVMMADDPRSTSEMTPTRPSRAMAAAL